MSALTELDKIEIVAMLDSRLSKLEDRLASAMQKALDTVLSDYERRLHSLEEDMATLQRHTGMM